MKRELFCGNISKALRKTGSSADFFAFIYIQFVHFSYCQFRGKIIPVWVLLLSVVVSVVPKLLNECLQCILSPLRNPV